MGFGAIFGDLGQSLADFGVLAEFWALGAGAGRGARQLAPGAPAGAVFGLFLGF